jgi:hypothetical protein
MEDHLREVGQNLPQLPADLQKRMPNDFIESLNQKIPPPQRPPEKKVARSLLDLVEQKAPKVIDRVSQGPPTKEASRPETPPSYPGQFSVKNLIENRGADPSKRKETLPVFDTLTDTAKQKEEALPPQIRAALQKMRQEEQAAAESGEKKPGLNMEPKKPPKRDVPKALQDLLNQKK